MGLSVAGQPPTVYSLGDGELRTPALMARGTGFASCRLRTQSRQRLAACKRCTETHCPWLTGFVFPASGMYGPLGVVLRNLCTRRRSSPLRAAGLPAAPRNPRGSYPSRAGRKSKDAPPRTRTACPAPGFPREVQADSHRPMQVFFHGVLLAPASSVGDDFPGRRSATARRLPERPHACCGCGEDEKDTACRTRADRCATDRSRIG